MATAGRATEIEYPESDGRPMGETDLHRDWMIRILEILRYRYRGQKVYIASDLLVYYEEGRPSKFVVPDVFVAFDREPLQRRTYKTWEEGKPPDVVFEVTSRSTSREDSVFKVLTYQRIGVRELFLYDPSAEYLEPSLQGYHLDEDGGYTPIHRLDGMLHSEALGVGLHLDDRALVLSDVATGQPCLTRADAEYEARLAAEAKVRELQAELDRLRGGG